MANETGLAVIAVLLRGVVLSRSVAHRRATICACRREADAVPAFAPGFATGIHGAAAVRSSPVISELSAVRVMGPTLSYGRFAIEGGGGATEPREPTARNDPGFHRVEPWVTSTTAGAIEPSPAPARRATATRGRAAPSGPGLVVGITPGNLLAASFGTPLLRAGITRERPALRVPSASFGVIRRKSGRASGRAIVRARVRA